MVTLKHVAKVAQLSHMQDQLIAMAIELGVDKDEFVQELSQGWDKQVEAFNTVLAVIAQATTASLIKGDGTDGN